MKKKKKGTLVKIAVLAAAVLIIGSLLARSLFSSEKPEHANLNQAYQVKRGNVDSTVSATGNISMDDYTDIVAATGVLVREVLVESGDEVKKGDILAKLDKTSVVSKLIEAKDTKEDLEDQLDDKDLSSLEEEKIEGEIEEINERIQTLNKLHDDPVIKATVSGIVSSVNVSEGNEITNTGTISGSASGLTNSTDTTSLTSIIPTSENSNSSGKSYTAAATSSSGNQNDSGIKAASLSAHSNHPIPVRKKITAVPLSASGDGSGTFDAAGDNTGTDSEGSGGSEGSQQSENTTQASEGSTKAAESDKDTDSSQNNSDTKDQGDNQGSGNVQGSGGNQGNVPEEDSRQVITDFSSLLIASPVVGQKVPDSVPSTGSYTGTITWSPSENTFQAGKDYSATVVLTARDGYVFRGNYEGGTVLNDGKQLKIVRSYGKAAEADNTGITGGGAGGIGAGDQTTQNSQQTTQFPNQSTQLPNQSTQLPNQTTQYPGQSQGGTYNPGNISIPGASAGGGLGNYSLGSSSAAASGTTEFYGTYQAAAFTINTRENVTIVVSIDELDILSIEKGQTAKVTLDALEDVEFEGTISKISTTATTSNGNTKYDVEISIPKNDKILDGMSASVVIVTDSAEDAVLVPVLALQERGEKQYVYTGQDEEGNLTDEVEVETGLSDGTNVEIISGLSEGDTIYYQMASGDDLEQMMNQNMQRNRDANMNGFGGGNSGQGGPGGNGGGPGGSGNGPGGNGGGTQ